MNAPLIASGNFTTRGYRALRRKVTADMQDRPEMERYYFGGMEIECSCDEREEFERGTEIVNALDSDVLDGRLFASFAAYCLAECGLKVERLSVANGPDKAEPSNALIALMACRDQLAHYLMSVPKGEDEDARAALQMARAAIKGGAT